jgi:hypothetical protein
MDVDHLKSNRLLDPLSLRSYTWLRPLYRYSIFTYLRNKQPLNYLKKTFFFSLLFLRNVNKKIIQNHVV